MRFMRRITNCFTLLTLLLLTEIAYGKVLILRKPSIVQGSITVDSLKSLNRRISTTASRTINIYIKSPGGDMDAIIHTVKLMDKAKERNVKFRCYVDEAYSAAMYLYAACDWRYASKTSTLLYHDGRAVLCGYFSQELLLETGKELQKANYLFNLKIRKQLRMELIPYNNTKEVFWLAKDLLEASHPKFLKIMTGVRLVK
jgi:ATP-dependent protease ClpP protease subunit